MYPLFRCLGIRSIHTDIDEYDKKEDNALNGETKQVTETNLEVARANEFMQNSEHSSREVASNESRRSAFHNYRESTEMSGRGNQGKSSERIIAKETTMRDQSLSAAKIHKETHSDQTVSKNFKNTENVLKDKNIESHLQGRVLKSEEERKKAYDGLMKRKKRERYVVFKL